MHVVLLVCSSLTSLVQFLSFLVNILLQIAALPLLPLRHIPYKTYVKRVDTTKVHDLKKELRALEIQLQKAHRRNSILSTDSKSKQSATMLVAAAPIVVAPPPPPPPPKMPPPPPPPLPGLKMPPKSWKTSTLSTTSEAPTLRAKPKAAAAKKGFDISADQIASMAGRLRKAGDAPRRAASVSSSLAAVQEAESSQHNTLSATLRASMKTRRSSLLQENDDNRAHHHNNNNNNIGKKEASPKNMFRAALKKAPVQRSPGGTPYRDPTATTVPKTPLPFNTALADMNTFHSPPRAADAPQF